MEEISTYFYQCYQVPDLIKVQVEDGKVFGIEPNLEAADVHPNAGKCCVKAYSLIDKHNNPNRIKTPLLRQNPEKGRNIDPEWKKISWDEAIDILAEKLNEISQSVSYNLFNPFLSMRQMFFLFRLKRFLEERHN